MEGPSLFLAAEQLAPFVGQRVRRVTGNTNIGKERLAGQTVQDIFSWGKHLVFQFPDFALRTHFLLFGSFEATVKRRSVTGDYKRRARTPRLALAFKNGHLEMYSCSVRYVESADARKAYDFTINLMSDEWSPARALRELRLHADEEIADVLLDQGIFAGLGNIIKNEILFLAGVHPQTRVGALPAAKRKALVGLAKSFSQQFYAWRKVFQLKKHLQVYHRSACPTCGGKIIRGKTGVRRRWSFYCPTDQPIR